MTQCRTQALNVFLRWEVLLPARKALGLSGFSPDTLHASETSWGCLLRPQRFALKLLQMSSNIILWHVRRTVAAVI